MVVGPDRRACSLSRRGRGEFDIFSRRIPFSSRLTSLWRLEHFEVYLHDLPPSNFFRIQHVLLFGTQRVQAAEIRN